jgi:hypothetical protein
MMTESGERGEFHLDSGRLDGRIDLVAVGEEPLDAVMAGLRGMISIALLDDPAALDATARGTAAVPIRGRGDDLAATFAHIASEVLGQLEDHGAGFAHVRIDGMLTADDGGYSTWGYLVGEGGWDPPVPMEIDGPVIVEQDGDGRVVLRCGLRRGGA